MRRFHILVVDDDPDIRETLRDVLVLEDYRVETAANGREALEWLHAAPFDLVVLDLMMPVMTGWQFRDAQLRDPAIAKIPVVVVSAAREPGVLRGCILLTKPFDLEAFLSLLRRTLAASAADRHHAGGSLTPVPH